MVVFKKYEMKLSPSKMAGKETLFEIQAFKDLNDCIRENPKTDKNGKAYSQYTLLLAGCDGEFVGDFVIDYLFDRDLKLLFDDYGEDSKSWIGKKVTITSVKDGKFDRWKIYPMVG